jgi:hypothetical protein
MAVAHFVSLSLCRTLRRFRSSSPMSHATALTANAGAALAPLELVSAHPWRRVVFTTYALSLSFFEAVILDALVRGGGRESLILADVEAASTTREASRGNSDSLRTLSRSPRHRNSGIPESTRIWQRSAVLRLFHHRWTSLCCEFISPSSDGSLGSTLLGFG